MLLRFLFPLLLSLLFSGCVIRPADHYHPAPVKVYQPAPQVYISTRVISYRDSCNHALSRNAYVPACDKYIQLTAQSAYASDYEIRQTRERFLRHKRRHEEAARQHQLRQQLSRYQRQCDGALARHDYVAACDKYLQLSAGLVWSDKGIKRTRGRYIAYKKQRKKEARNQPGYVPPPRPGKMTLGAQQYIQYDHGQKKKQKNDRNRLIKLQRTCDKALANKVYTSACDRYLKLTSRKPYVSERKIIKVRQRFLKYKRRYMPASARGKKHEDRHADREDDRRHREGDD